MPGNGHRPQHPYASASVPSFDSTQLFAPGDRKPSVDNRPRTADLLSIPIPSYRIGTPQFNERGSAYLRSSMQAAPSTTDGKVSSAFSETDFVFPAPPRQSGVSAQLVTREQQPLTQGRGRVLESIDLSEPTPPPSGQGRMNIDAKMYDEIAARPDNPAYVKYSRTTGDIVAGTPARLIAQITAVRFLDYELLSDFFLTYRGFMSAFDLVRYLMARMQWAFSHGNDSGRIVRVRTFVALRHWILNYFIDDFEPDYDLRLLFCDLVNQLSSELQQRPGGGGGDLQVLGELKKCWRRTCAIVWDTSDAGRSYSIGDEVKPSGAENIHHGTLVEGKPGGAARSTGAPGAESETSRTGNPGGWNNIEMPGLPNTADEALALMRKASIQATSPLSDVVLSCSIPIRKRFRPVTMEQAPKIAWHQKAEKPKTSARPGTSASIMRRPSGTHKRSGSFSDALRDERAAPDALPSSASGPQEFFPGALIRGFLVQPASPYIASHAPLSPPVPAAVHRLRSDNMLAQTNENTNSSMTQKLMGSVRRALSTRNNASQYSMGRGHGPSDSSGSNRLRRNAPQILDLADADQGRQQRVMRSDFLAAIIVRTYAQYVQEERAQIEAKNASNEEAVRQAQPPQREVDQSVSPKRAMQRLGSHVTTGSRSIVIVDDTGTPDSRRIPQVPELDGTRTFPNPHKRQASEATARTEYFGTNNMDQMLRNNSDVTERQSPSTHPNLNDIAFLMPTWTSQTRPPLQPLVGVNHSDEQSGTVSSLGIDEALFNDGNLHSVSPLADPTSPGVYRKSSIAHPSELNQSPPPNKLRRRPGGDLRAVDNVHDLGPRIRRRSTGSMSSITYSAPTSATHSRNVSTTQPTSRLSRPPTLGYRSDSQLSTSAPKMKDSLKLLSTHSSQPNLRASFEREVQRLAKMPHSEANGDIESTLLKLEGRFGHANAEPLIPSPTSEEGDLPQVAQRVVRSQVQVVGHPDHPQTSRLDLDDPLLSPRTETRGASIYEPSQASDGALSERSSPLPEASPPLKGPEQLYLRHNKSVSDTAGKSRSSLRLQSQRSQPVSQRASSMAHKKSDSNVSRTEANSVRSPKKARFARPESKRSVTERSSTPQSSSFLLDDDESLSEDEPLERIRTIDFADGRTSVGTADRSFFLDDDIEEEDEEAHNHHSIPAQRPPTPPSTVDGVTPLASPPDPQPQDKDLTPGPVATSNHPQAPMPAFPTRSPPALSQPPIPQRPKSYKLAPPIEPMPTAHYPFVLAFPSLHLARQMTIIEQAFLEELDWKELISFPSNTTTPSSTATSAIQNWATYLRTSTGSATTGIDLITARFNLVVKWTVSSIVLTADPGLRTQLIAKYIHVAAHARRLHNYATVYQLVTALLSSSISPARLQKTWDALPAAETATLRELEELVQPSRNFARLRAEMEMKSGDGGGPAKLVNFERFQTAAAVVKGLLRLLEASARYRFEPDREVLGRCLWLAALGDAEVRERGRGLV
ncbi:Guanine nucleotide exchange factor lte1 [Zalaria obscura]|uniref:Guanine nucleotide exchange factor lte1 n=1 Tax=Zalaria obscura TaxID=2024903 RepID=A0ACC3SB72_9PEZI